MTLEAIYANMKLGRLAEKMPVTVYRRRKSMTLLEDGHLSEDAIELYSMARLDESMMEAFEEHLLLCTQCQDRLQEADLFVQAYRTAATQVESEVAASLRLDPTPAPVSRWAWLSQALTGWRPLYAMGGALAAAALVVVLVPRGERGALTEHAIELQAIRGNATASLRVPATARLDLTLDLTGLPEADPLRVEIAAETGGIKWTSSATRPQGDKLTVKPATVLEPGLYWVRIYGPGNGLLREFGLELKR